MKKGRMKKGVVVKPIVTSDVNRRAQVDCIDMQSNPDGEYRYIMVYLDLDKDSSYRRTVSSDDARVAKRYILSGIKIFTEKCPDLIFHGFGHD